ncbi:MAG: pantoate--beta-alanine ligase, partial [Dehalococcoidales bacterium]|nr:pantoate--beta-alanine ligase [Dehalococcoidales bacterium]
MKVAESISEMKKLRRQLPGPVGLVPTMGYLHEGHLSLVRQAKAENASAVVSIFVNPTQFAANEDFGKYPRDPKHDATMLEEIGTDVLFRPPPTDMYPPDFDTWVEVSKLTKRLEGEVRPTHFRGVTTVVAKLFNIVQPDKAYFGQKDVQQALVITRMATDLNMPLEVITLPTVREPDGLAMSSRNVYLNPAQRRGAVVLHQALDLARRLYDDGEREAEKIRRQLTSLIQKEPEATR